MPMLGVEGSYEIQCWWLPEPPTTWGSSEDHPRELLATVGAIGFFMQHDLWLDQVCRTYANSSEETAWTIPMNGKRGGIVMSWERLTQAIVNENFLGLFGIVWQVCVACACETTPDASGLPANSWKEKKNIYEVRVTAAVWFPMMFHSVMQFQFSFWLGIVFSIYIYMFLYTCNFVRWGVTVFKRTVAERVVAVVTRYLNVLLA